MASEKPFWPTFSMFTPKLRVLIGGGNDEVRRRMVRLLDTEFEIAAVVADGLRLVDTVRATFPEVVVCDLFMPLLDGFETIGKFNDQRHKSENAIPFVLVSAGFRFTGVSDCPGVVAYVDAIDLAADLALAVRCAALGLRFLSRSIPRSPT